MTHTSTTATNATNNTNSTTRPAGRRIRKGPRFIAALATATLGVGVAAIAVGGHAVGAKKVPVVTLTPSQLAQLSDFARANGLSGLSPASLTAGSATPTGRQSADSDAVYAQAIELAAIAEWAKANNLAGLSPASLQTNDD